MEFLGFMLIGFVAEFIDSTLGMAYGVSATTFLLSMGLMPALASAVAHTAELVLTGLSGMAHIKFGNFDKALFMKLFFPGLIGGGLGAYVLVNIPGNILKPYVSIYLLLMGLRILVVGVRQKKKTATAKQRGLFPLGLIGGFFDAIGGGGWGPIVTTTLISSGKDPKKSIGSVNAAEFFVTCAESLVFILAIPTLLSKYALTILAILLGGCFAAPLGAYVCHKLPTIILQKMVGLLIIIVSLRTLLQILKII
jgi:uncharacterized protein